MPKVPWTESEERDIDKSAEARVRAARILRAEQEEVAKKEREARETKEKEEAERRAKEKSGNIDIL